VSRTACVVTNQLSKENEWDPQKRRSAATVEGFSVCEHGTEGMHFESAHGSPSVRRSQMWNGDLNEPRAKATSQMIMGMIDVPINNNQHASMDEDVGDRVHGVWTML